MPCTLRGRIDRRDPVVRDHPLNRGRVAWWMGLPHQAGGSRLYDLMGHYSAEAIGAAQWGRAGDFATAKLNGSTDYRAAADNLPALTGCTYGVRFTPDAAFVAGANQVLFARWIDDSSFSWNQTVVYHTNYVYTDSATKYSYRAPWTPVAGKESHIVWTATGSQNGFKCYVDGALQSVSEVVWYGAALDTAGLPFWLGGHAAERYCTGSLAEAFVLNRILSAAEIAQLYAESRVGYPNLIRRHDASRALLAPVFRPWYADDAILAPGVI